VPEAGAPEAALKCAPLQAGGDFCVSLSLFISIVFAILFLGPMGTAPREPPGPLAMFLVVNLDEGDWVWEYHGN